MDSSGVGVVDRADSPYSRVGKKIRRSRTRTKIKRPDSTRIESGLLAFARPEKLVRLGFRVTHEDDRKFYMKRDPDDVGRSSN